MIFLIKMLKKNFRIILEDKIVVTIHTVLEAF